MDIGILLALQDFRNGSGAFLADFLADTKYPWCGSLRRGMGLCFARAHQGYFVLSTKGVASWRNLGWFACLATKGVFSWRNVGLSSCLSTKQTVLWRGPGRGINKKETSVAADLLVRWARLELAQDYSHYPLKVACLPFHHHRFCWLGLQRYDKKLNFQTFSQKFSKKVHFFVWTHILIHF